MKAPDSANAIPRAPTCRAVAASDPCDALDRPKLVPGSPLGLNGSQLQRLLAGIPQTRLGLRDRAIVLTLTFTGRRSAPHAKNEYIALNRWQHRGRGARLLHLPGQGSERWQT